MGPLESLGHRELDAAIPSSIRDSGAELQCSKEGHFYHRKLRASNAVSQALRMM